MKRSRLGAGLKPRPIYIQPGPNCAGLSDGDFVRGAQLTVMNVRLQLYASVIESMTDAFQVRRPPGFRPVYLK